MSYETILFEVSDGVARLTLNRPDKLNAFTEQMHLEVRSAIDAAEQQGARCMLLTAAGRGFCAGQDLSARKTGPGQPRPDLGETLGKFYNPLIKKINSIEFPVVCAVNGVAAGAGANLALACDIVIAAKSAKFIQAFSKIGLIPDSGGTWVLPRLVGHARAMALTLLAEPVMADRAVEMGMIYQAVNDNELQATATAMADKLAKAPTLGLALTKQAIHAAYDNHLPDQLELERQLQRRAGHSDDYREGVAAFMEKRAPQFKGQ